MLSSRLTRVLILLLCVVGVPVVIVAVDDDGDGRPDRFVVPRGVPVAPAVVATDNGDKDPAFDNPVKLSPQARAVALKVAAAPAKYDMEPNVRGHDPTPVAKYDAPLASAYFPGCEQHILPTNWSERVSSVRALAEHYTAGVNIPNSKADMNGLLGFASNPAAQVSWHFLIDADGYCYQMVPLTKKAWTIGNLNSQTVNIETIGTGREAAFPAAVAGQMKLYAVSQRILRIYHLPVRLGATDGRCNVTVTGVITHWMGGPCSGGHIDIKPYDIAALVRAIAAYHSFPPITGRQRAKCHELNTIRRRAARTGKWTPRGRADRIKAAEAKHHLRCRVAKHPHLVRV